ncbi:2-keto-4-pentenoate hydratase [Niveispirillum fermenti]|uniref:2-keto-4-pentenoate hydratase n=1 Tax=Niveispirillum fermenti TaxID=1233113 RepID=UPI003A87F974
MSERDDRKEVVLADMAARLRNAYRQGPVAPLRHELPEADLDTAYRIQSLNTAHWLEQGRRLVGRKIGLTSVAVQKQLGVDQPDYGMLFDDMAILDGGSVPAGTLLQPRIEAEVAFVLKQPLDREKLLLPDVVKAIDFALPALEIVDSRIAGWDIGIVDTIADNASSGLFVLGTTPVPIDRFDLRLCGMVMERNGDPVSLGVGAACLGNPLNALIWLAERMAAVGYPLGPGDVVLSGALGAMVPAKPGERYEASIGGLGSVRVSFAAD